MLPFENCIRKVKYTNKIASQDFKTFGRFPIVSQEEAFISGYWDNPEDVFHIDGPVVIFGDHSRHIKYVDFDFVIGADGVKILAPTDNVSAKYLYYYLKSQPIRSLGYSRHYKVLKEKTVPVPSLPEQRRIVDELDLLSRIVELKNAQLRTLDELAQSIFYEMFGDPQKNTMNWTAKAFKEVFRLKSGDGLKEKEFVPGEYPVYGGNGISGYHNSFNKSGQHIIIGRVGAYCGNVRLVDDNFWLTDNAFEAFFDPQIFDFHFVCMLLNMLNLHKYANHAAQPVISNTGLKDIPIIIPPMSKQIRYADCMKLVERQRKAISESLNPAKDLLASRMDKYFNE